MAPEGALDPLPALVAIHGEVASGHRRDLTHADSACLLLDLAQISGATLGRRVAAVQKGVYENLLDAFLLGHLEQRVEVRELRVHATRTAQAQQVEMTPARMMHGVQQRRVAEEFAVGNHLVDTRDVHQNDASRADVEMAHFAVAHLPVRQSDKRSGRVDQRVGKLSQQLVVRGLERGGDGVAFVHR